MKLLCLFALSVFCASSQPVTFGFKAGVPVTDLLDSMQSNSPYGATSTTNSYLIGPTVELRLPRNLSIELDALFRHCHYTWYINLIGDSSQTTGSGNAWEFPLLVKYKLTRGFLKPYVAGGVAVNRVQGLSATVISYPLFKPPIITQTSTPQELEHKGSPGIVVGTGVDLHALFLHISPEIRYTRWTSQQFGTIDLQSNQNQVEFLLGITF